MRRRTLEEKLEAIRLVEEGNSPRSVSDRLHIGHHQIYEWLYIYKEKVNKGGKDALARKQPSSPREQSKSIMKRLPKEECEKENERLRKENERLRAENLLLKKVKALVEERESRNRRIGRGPLTN